MREKYTFKDFTGEHVEEAGEMARMLYAEQCGKLETLPSGASVPGLERYAKNGMGVAAFKNGRMAGYLTCNAGIENFFGTSPGAYSPVFAHGTTEEDKPYIYSLMYQQAAKKWVGEGLLSHVISIYAADTDVLQGFVWNGFGYRTVDGIMDPLSVSIPAKRPDMKYLELPVERYGEILENQNRLIRHLNQSPCFIPYKEMTSGQFDEAVNRQKARFFAALDGDKVIGHIKLSEGGESFIGDHGSVINICGAYMAEDYRGGGIYDHLLSYTVAKMADEGYSAVGVDCESFNPTARGFWLKYFTPIIFGLTRRIDERMLDFDDMV